MSDEFDPDGLDKDWPEYPPGSQLPDFVPAPMRVLIESAWRAGNTVRIESPGPDGTGGMTIRGSGAANVLADALDQLGSESEESTVSPEPATEGHEPNHDCIICRANRNLFTALNTDELSVAEKTEAVDKIIAAAVKEARDTDQPFIGGSLQAQHVQYQALVANRGWLSAVVDARIAEYTERVGTTAVDKMVEQLKVIRDDLLASDKEKVDPRSLYQHAMDMFVLKDIRRLKALMLSRPIQFTLEDSILSLIK